MHRLRAAQAPVRPDLVDVSLERSGSTASFRVVPRDPELGDVLAAMGFDCSDDGFVRSFPDSADVQRIFENFATHVDEMLRHKTGEARAPWEGALELVVDRLTGEVDWWLSGSAALAVRDIAVEPRDVDLVVDGAERVGELLREFAVEPVKPMAGWVADRHGRAFSGALIEWVSGVHPDVDRPGRSEQGPEAARRREEVVWRRRPILCSPLDLQLAVSAARGLDDRVAAIRNVLA